MKHMDGIGANRISERSANAASSFLCVAATTVDSLERVQLSQWIRCVRRNTPLNHEFGRLTSRRGDRGWHNPRKRTRKKTRNRQFLAIKTRMRHLNSDQEREERMEKGEKIERSVIQLLYRSSTDIPFSPVEYPDEYWCIRRFLLFLASSFSLLYFFFFFFSPSYARVEPSYILFSRRERKQWDRVTYSFFVQLVSRIEKKMDDLRTVSK